MKLYNPLSISLDKPSFINDEGVKWYAVDVGDRKYGTAFYVVKPDGNRSYVVIKNDKPVYIESFSLEQLMYWYTQQELMERFENGGAK